jgi:hypothetical protein
MFSHYSSFIPLVLVLCVWGTFVTLCVTVTNIYWWVYNNFQFMIEWYFCLNQYFLSTRLVLWVFVQYTLLKKMCLLSWLLNILTIMYKYWPSNNSFSFTINLNDTSLCMYPSFISVIERVSHSSYVVVYIVLLSLL